MKLKFLISALLTLNLATSLRAENQELRAAEPLTSEVNLIASEFDDLLAYEEIKAFYDTLNADEQNDIRNAHEAVREIVEETVQKFSKLAEDNKHLLEKLKEHNGSSGILNFSIGLSTQNTEEPVNIEN